MKSRKNGSKHRSNKNRSHRHRGGGRTLNIPPPVPGHPELMPGPSYNNGWYIGEPCNGSHCGVPMTPSAPWMINKGLQIGNDVTPGSTTMYPVIDRPGNSFAAELPGQQSYVGTTINPGPFDIRCASGGSNKSRRKSSRSHRSAKRSHHKRHHHHHHHQHRS
jgi:hypothetical protein